MTTPTRPDAPPDPRFERVTEPQRECLRLVLTRRNSKEIAQQLGISPFTVDKRLARAVATLAVANRFEAARLLAGHEGLSGYETFAYQSPDIVAASGTGEQGVSQELAPAGGIQEIRPSWLPVRPKGGRVNTLTVWQRLLWIFTIPAAMAIAVGMLGFGLSVAGRVLRVILAAMS